jgi:cytoskeletal protein CcmA (bactofilin family)
MPKPSTLNHEADIVTVLGSSTSFSGTLKFDSSLMIRGHFDGNIEAKGELFIDEGASVDVGKMKAMSIVVGGSIHGDMEAADKVELRSSAQVRGNVKTVKLRISDGVLFEGRCEMVRDGESFDPFAQRSSSGS